MSAMDPISILHNRIEQLEAKLGLVASMTAPMQQNEQVDPNSGSPEMPQQSDSITANLLQAANTMNQAAAGYEKIAQAMPMATELNNYCDPNIVENIQQNNIQMQEVVAAEPIIKHHCHCMNQCKKAAPVLQSEPIAQVPQMQAVVNEMQAAAQEISRAEDTVSEGIQELARNCEAAAAQSTEKIINVAEQVKKAEEKILPKRRNGLDD